MFEIMKHMSQQMMDMSKIMEKGKASKEEMKMMLDKMAQIQKKMSDLEMK
jgi:ABC-type Fe3+-hydroxamate transport system substrate-binding protein